MACGLERPDRTLWRGSGLAPVPSPGAVGGGDVIPVLRHHTSCVIIPSLLGGMALGSRQLMLGVIAGPLRGVDPAARQRPRGLLPSGLS